MTTAAPTLYLAAPRGFCAGVDRAGAPVIFSAHGVSPAVRREAAERGLKPIDATCPLVTKVHLEALRHAREGTTIVLVGHRRHVEVQGTLGEAPESIVVVESVAEAEALEVADPARVAYITQTTLSVDDCRAIVEELARRCGVVLVVGAPASSNANRLVEVAGRLGARAYLIESAEDIRPEWLDGDVGVTAGASTPEDVVMACVERLRALRGYRVEEFRMVEERVMFPLPVEILGPAQQRGVAIAAGNERAAARASADYRIRHH